MMSHLFGVPSTPLWRDLSSWSACRAAL